MAVVLLSRLVLLDDIALKIVRGLVEVQSLLCVVGIIFTIVVVVRSEQWCWYTNLIAIVHELLA